MVINYYFTCVKRLFFILILIHITSISYGQDITLSYLDSLVLKPAARIEKAVGANKKAQLLLKQIDTTQENIEQVNLISKYYETITESTEDNNLAYLDWAINTSKKLNYDEGYATCKIIKADLIQFIDKSKSLSYYKEIIDATDKIKNPERYKSLISSLALIHYSYEDFDAALNLFFEYKEINESSGTAESKVINFHNIADCYLQINDYENALKYFCLSNTYEKKAQRISVKAMNFGMMGEIYAKQGKLTKAQNFIEKSQKIIDDYGVVPYLTNYNLANLGFIFEENKNYRKALNYYKKGLLSSYGYENSLLPCIINTIGITRILNKLNKYQDAILVSQKVYNEAILKGPQNYLKTLDDDFAEFYHNFAVAYENEGDFKNANYFFKKELNSIKSGDPMQLQKSINAIEKKYQAKIKEQEVQLLKDENNLRKRNNTIYIISSLVIISFLVWIGYYFRQKMRDEKRISQINALELKIKEKEKFENFRNKISADLHDDVGSLLTGLAMQTEMLIHQVPEEQKYKLERINSVSKRAMLQMRDNVWSMDARKDTWQSLKDRIQDFALEIFEDKDIVFSLELKGIPVTAAIESTIRQTFYLVVKEALTNVLKHSNATKVRVELGKDSNKYYLIIQDNGSNISNITTSGQGLSNIKLRAGDINGTCSITTENGFLINLEKKI